METLFNFAVLGYIFLVFYGGIILLAIFMAIVFWKIFTKAGQPGWTAIIPFYSGYIFVVKIAKVSIWYFIAALVPTLLVAADVDLPAIEGVFSIVLFVAYIVLGIVVSHNLSKRFGKGTGYTIGLIILPLIFYPMLAFGNSVYLSDEQVENQPEQVPVDVPTHDVSSVTEVPVPQTVTQQENPQNSQTPQTS